ncbi:MAG: SPOR domain-containing protein [Moraxella sp.]|uniref:SPOR domain-containing protein n=1 Tax=Moraxella sp. TaxID=479 RepID=UPI0026DABAF2|nr:SPOR domain-containing protein [Moraxella sp.]MDO4450187.1 SPOR domain-containing protein [Moraxella sp.]
MKKNYDKPISRQQKDRISSGLASLLWMFVGAMIAVMVGVFLYLSPLFDSFKADVDVNPPMQVQPLPATPEQPENYEFYEVLPKREFQMGRSVVGEKTEEVAVASSVKPDVVINADKATKVITPAEKVDTQNQGVAIVEEETTYDGDDTKDNIKISISQNSYILQIRSYDNPEEADRMRAEVMMSGVDARVIKRMDNDTEIYQVVSNVMNASEVSRASRRLKDNGIDALIVEQKH